MSRIKIRVGGKEKRRQYYLNVPISRRIGLADHMKKTPKLYKCLIRSPPESVFRVKTHLNRREMLFRVGRQSNIVTSLWSPSKACKLKGYL
jgi:hypothetical protein